MGQKRTDTKKRQIKLVSERRAMILPEYYKLVDRLRKLCNNRSELSGDAPDWQSRGQVEPHHIRGRTGDLLIDPLNIIMLCRDEHDIQEGKVKGDKVSDEDLLALVKELRCRQGY